MISPRAAALLAVLVLAPGMMGNTSPPPVSPDPVFLQKISFIERAVRSCPGAEPIPLNVASSMVRAIEAAAKQYHQDPDRIYSYLYVESRFNTFAIGDDGKSIGLGQVSLVTARDLAGRDVTREELLDWRFNLMLSVRFFASVRTFEAYNAGESGARLGRGLRHARRCERILRHLPWRTRR